MPMGWGCMQPHTLAYVSPTFLGHMAQTSRGQVCQCMGATCTHTHWHTFPLLVWAIRPRTVGGKYANAWGPRATSTHCYTVPLLFWAMWPNTVGESRGKYANAWVLHATLHMLMCFTIDFSMCFYAMFHFFPATQGPRTD